MTDPEDQRLLSELRARRPEACAELVRVHYQAVYRFLVHMTRDVHKAEDLTQETFTTAWEKISTFQGRASLATWLHRIAYTKCIDAQRAERRTEVMLGHMASPKSSPPDPLEIATACDEVEHLYRALHGLDVPDHTVLVLHYLQGMSYREMACVLDEPTGTVKWRTCEALKRLRTLLTSEVPHHAQ